MPVVTNNKNKTASGDELGNKDFFGTDGTNSLRAASIQATADSDAVDGAVPGKLSFKTANSSGVLTEAFNIDSSQVLNFGTGSIARDTRQLIVPALGNAKVGATAGWIVTAGTNISHATIPAGVTGGTLVMSIDGLYVGDVVSAVYAVGQIESGGNVASATMSVRTLTASAVTALTDAEIGSDQYSINADALMTVANANLAVTGLTQTMSATMHLYVLITATTAAATDIDLSHLVVVVNQK